MNNTIKLETPGKPLMVAHRGCSGLEKENTASAFVAAGNRSYFGIETDVHRTSDGKYILFHDDNTKRVAQDEMVIEKTSFKTLRSLQLCDKDDQKGRMDLMMPTIAEYMGICKRYDKIAVLEVKNHMKPQWIDEIVEEVRATGWLEHTVFISFDLANMICLRERLPEQQLQFLVEDFNDWLVDTLSKYHMDVDIYFRNLTAEQVDKVHAIGQKVNVWTVDTLDDGQRMTDIGVDYITSNILE